MTPSGNGWSHITSGALGSALAMDGTTSGFSYFQNTSLLAGLPSTNWGVGVYFKPVAATAGTVMQFNGGSNGSPLINFDVGSGIYRTSVSGNGNTFNYPSTYAAASAIGVGKWDHLAMINVNGVTGFYLNGVKVGNDYTGAISLGQLNLGIKAGGAGELNSGAFDMLSFVSFDSTDTATAALAALMVPEPGVSAYLALPLVAAGFRRRRK